MAVPIVPIVIGALSHSVVAFVALKKGYEVGYRDGISAADWMASTPSDWGEALKMWSAEFDRFEKEVNDLEKDSEEE